MSWDRFGLPALLLVFLGLFSIHLGEPELTPIDESRSGVLVREMAERGNWLLPRTPDGFLTEKPPAYYGTAALLSIPFGTHEWTLRFISVLAALGTLAVVWLIVRLYGSHQAAAVAVIALGTNVFFATWARRAMVDMTMTFFLTAGLAAYLAARNGRIVPGTCGLLCGISFGLAVLTKGPIGLAVPFVIMAADLLIPVRGRFWKLKLHWMPLATAVGLIVAISLTWYLPGFLKGGSEFLHTSLLDENFYMPLGLSHGIAGSHQKPLPYYPLNLLKGLFPLAILLPETIRWLCSRDNAVARRQMATWFLAGFCLFMAASNKRQYYLLPIFPAVAVLIGLAAERALLATPSSLLRRTALACGLLFIGVGLAGIVGVLRPFELSFLDAEIKSLLFDFRITMLVFTGVLLAIGVWLVVTGASSRRLIGGALLFALLTVAVRTMAIDPAMGQIDGARSTIAKWTTLIPAGAHVAAQGSLHGYGVEFYWPGKLSHDAADVEKAAWIVTRAENIPEVRGTVFIMGRLSYGYADREIVLLRRE